MKKISKIDAAYIAGFFDGEGCVRTAIRGYYNPRISIGQKFPNILYEIQKITEFGKVRLGKKINIYCIYNKREVIKFINLILPYSRTKRKQLEVTLTILSTIDKNRSPKFLPHQVLGFRKSLCKELKKLKRQDYEQNCKQDNAR